MVIYFLINQWVLNHLFLKKLLVFLGGKGFLKWTSSKKFATQDHQSPSLNCLFWKERDNSCFYFTVFISRIPRSQLLPRVESGRRFSTITLLLGLHPGLRTFRFDNIIIRARNKLFRTRPGSMFGALSD